MLNTSGRLKESNDDELIFASETDAHDSEYPHHNENWKILVVDDLAAQVHAEGARFLLPAASAHC